MDSGGKNDKTLLVSIWRSWIIHILMVRMQNGRAIPKRSLAAFIKVNMQLLPYDSAIELLSIYLKEIKA